LQPVVEVYGPAGDLRARIGDTARVGSRAVGTLNGPTAAAWDVDGTATRLLVLERGNRRLQAFGSTGTPLGIVLTTASTPADLFLDAGRSIYVALSTTHRIDVYAPNGTPLRTIGRFGLDAAGLNGPVSIAVAGDGTLHVVDAGSATVKIFADGSYVGRYGGKDGPADGRLVAPTSVRFDGAGRAWVADAGANVIRIYGGDGAYLGQVRPQTAAGGPATPLRLAARPDGSIYASVVPAASV
jgi:DNA-binding beta-propeller fold protein YncE